MSDTSGCLPDRTGTDELKAIFSGGIIAFVLAYLSLRFAIPCSSPPIAFLEQNPQTTTWLSSSFTYLILVAAGFPLLHLLSLSVGYGLSGVSEKRGGNFKRAADFLFLVSVITTIIVLAFYFARYVEYWNESKGLNSEFIRNAVIACKASEAKVAQEAAKLANQTSFGG